MSEDLRSALGMPAKEMKYEASGAPPNHHQVLHDLPMVTQPIDCPTVEQSAATDEQLVAAAPQSAGDPEIKAGKPNIPVTMVTGSPLDASSQEPRANLPTEQPPASQLRSTAAQEAATAPTSPAVESPAVVAEPPAEPKSITKPDSALEAKPPHGPVLEAPGATPIAVTEGNVEQLRQNALSQALQQSSRLTGDKSAPERGQAEPALVELPGGATIAGA